MFFISRREIRLNFCVVFFCSKTFYFFIIFDKSQEISSSKPEVYIHTDYFPLKEFEEAEANDVSVSQISDRFLERTFL